MISTHVGISGGGHIALVVPQHRLQKGRHEVGGHLGTGGPSLLSIMVGVVGVVAPRKVSAAGCGRAWKGME